MRRADRLPAPAGFTLIEVAVVLLVIAVLASVAWPSYQAQRLQARRAEAKLALMQLQQRQLRWRADHPAYASAADLDAPPLSPNGHYRLTVELPEPGSFTLQATAEGAQRADTACAVLRLQQVQAHTRLASRSSHGIDNPDTTNRRCWNP